MGTLGVAGDTHKHSNHRSIEIAIPQWITPDYPKTFQSLGTASLLWDRKRITMTMVHSDSQLELGQLVRESSDKRRKNSCDFCVSLSLPRGWVDVMTHSCASFSFLFFFFFWLFRATHATYGSSQARCPIRAVATGLCHSQSNAGSKLHLWPTPDP